jgi:hypothetical protein
MRALSYTVLALLLAALFYVVATSDEDDLFALVGVVALAALIALVSDAARGGRRR